MGNAWPDVCRFDSARQARLLLQPFLSLGLLRQPAKYPIVYAAPWAHRPLPFEGQRDLNTRHDARARRPPVAGYREK